MRFYADLHVHSKHSRGCSRDSDLEHVAWWAGRKGIGVVGTGDFTHPGWADELREKLVPAEPGLFRLRGDLEDGVLRRLPPSCRTPVRFLLSVEISTIYRRAERTRKVHHLVYVPDLDVASAVSRRLSRIGNLGSDGRPILGLDSRDLLEIVLESSPYAYLVPAHVWTPWFAVLGSKSGFDAVDDCYADLAQHIFALETGLSADPAMCWQVSGLDRFRLVSNSDAHSPPMLGREATVFDTDLDYLAIRAALETGVGLAGTVEFFPEEGKYHLDGHRACQTRLRPAETRAHDGRCPACGRPATVGVLHRVEMLADRVAGHRPTGAPDFRRLVPLPEVIGEILGVGPKSKAVARHLDGLVARLGPELEILERLPLAEVAGVASAALVEALGRLREGRVIREAGYDGEYGVIRLFKPAELPELRGAPLLFDGPAPVAPVPRQRPRPVAREETVPAPAVAAGPAATRGSSILDRLDPDQRAAAELTDGPMLVVAGPGTGKTRVLTHRLAHLVADRGVPAEQCIALTFTRRARDEMRERLRDLLPRAGDRLLVTTFHGLGLRIVREQAQRLGLPVDVRVADDAVRAAVLRDVLGAGGRDVGRVGAVLTEEKHRCPVERSATLRAYDAALHARGLVDLDDLMVLPVQLLSEDPALVREYRGRFRHVSVDEYQDVDRSQYRLLSLLCPPDGNLCAIGDPDQAIYGFRGADVGFFLRFREDFPRARVVRLTRNYRSTPTIVAGALQAVAPATLVRDRALEAVRTDDAPILVHAAADESDEAAAVAATIERLLGGTSLLSFDRGRAHGATSTGLSLADFAVLYRTDAQSRPILDALQREGIPVQKRSHERLANHPGVRAVLRLLPEGDEPRSVLQLVRAAGQAGVDAAGTAGVDAAGRAGGDAAGPAEADSIRAAIDLLTPLASDCGLDLRRFRTELALGAEVDTWDPRADRVSLLTLHAAKGLEFPVVFVVGCEQGLLPLQWSGPVGDNVADTAEERRLFFVGMTRATSRLILTYARRRSWRGAVRIAAASPFLADIDPTLLDHNESAGPASGSGMGAGAGLGTGSAASRARLAGTQLRLL